MLLCYSAVVLLCFCAIVLMCCCAIVLLCCLLVCLHIFRVFVSKNIPIPWFRHGPRLAQRRWVNCGALHERGSNGLFQTPPENKKSRNIFSNTGNCKQHFYTNFGPDFQSYITHWLSTFFYMGAKFETLKIDKKNIDIRGDEIFRGEQPLQLFLTTEGTEKFWISWK